MAGLIEARCRHRSLELQRRWRQRLELRRWRRRELQIGAHVCGEDEQRGSEEQPELVGGRGSGERRRRRRRWRLHTQPQLMPASHTARNGGGNGAHGRRREQGQGWILARLTHRRTDPGAADVEVAGADRSSRRRPCAHAAADADARAPLSIRLDPSTLWPMGAALAVYTAAVSLSRMNMYPNARTGRPRTKRTRIPRIPS